MTTETDRELLMLAAKADGKTIVCFSSEDGHIVKTGVCFGEAWNPLDDDGDALRLSVKLKIRIGFRPQAYADTPSGIRFFGAHEGDDANARTRLAIVRAAAEIGRSMK